MKNIKNAGKILAKILADYILKNYGPMSHLKLQKLLFYCDAYHLAFTGEELVVEKFQAWVHGPVCVEVYNQLKEKSILYSDMGFDVINNEDPDPILNNKLSTYQIDLINDILRNLNTWTDLELEASTHSEEPWIKARIGYAPHQKCQVEIDKQITKNFYQLELS